MHVGNGLGNDDIAGGFLDNGEGLKNGDAAADEGAEGAREAGDGDLGEDGTEDGDFEFELVEESAAEFGVNGDLKKDDENDNAKAGPADVQADGIADSQDNEGELREGLSVAEAAGKDLLELGNDDDHRERP